jgi:drug/metabolite transporter (DMT)-like permease
MPCKSNQLRNWSLGCFVNFLWAAQYPAYKVAAGAMGIGALNVWTFVIAVLVLTPVLIRERRYPRRNSSGRKPWGPIVLLAAFGIVPGSIVLSWGIGRSTASNAAILSLAIPVMMALMGVVLLKERPQRFFIASLALALVGTTLVSWDDIVSGSFTGNLLAGNAAIFVGAAGSAFYNVYGKRLLGELSAMEVLIYSYVVSIFICMAVSMIADPVPFYAVTQWPLAAWLGVLVLGTMSWGLAMALWFWLMKRLEVSQLAVMVYLLPALGVALSAVTLGEHIHPMQWVGAFVVLGSAYVSSAQEQTGE